VASAAEFSMLILVAGGGVALKKKDDLRKVEEI